MRKTLTKEEGNSLFKAGGTKIFVESDNGHDTIEVPKKDVEGEVKTQLKDGKWVTLEKEDGTTEVLTPKDLPEDELDEEDKKLQEKMKSSSKKPDDWKNSFGKSKEPAKISAVKPTNFSKKFEKVRTATATKPAKGG